MSITDRQYKQRLISELGMGTDVHFCHMPKHARQSCDVVYGSPLPLSGVLPVVKRTYTPLSLRELTSALIVGNSSPSDLQS